MSEKKVGVISSASVGCDDRFGEPELRMSIQVGPGMFFAEGVRFPRAAEIIKDAQVSDVTHLKGKACYYTEERGLCSFVEVWQ